MKTLISPKGIARYTWLTEPDTKFDQHGTFRVELVVPRDAPEVQSFIKDLDAIRDEHFQKHLTKEIQSDLTKAQLKALRVQDTFSEVWDEEGEATDQVSFNVKMRAVSWNSGSSQCSMLPRKPTQYNRSGRRLGPEEEYPLIPDGSIIRVGCAVDPYVFKLIGVGLSLKLLAVQICELAVLPMNIPFDFPAE